MTDIENAMYCLKTDIDQQVDHAGTLDGEMWDCEDKGNWTAMQDNLSIVQKTLEDSQKAYEQLVCAYESLLTDAKYQYSQRAYCTSAKDYYEIHTEVLVACKKRVVDCSISER